MECCAQFKLFKTIKMINRFFLNINIYIFRVTINYRYIKKTEWLMICCENKIRWSGGFNGMVPIKSYAWTLGPVTGTFWK